jgi:hypothetical protein
MYWREIKMFQGLNRIKGLQMKFNHRITCIKNKKSLAQSYIC